MFINKMPEYEGIVIRPPSEADSIIVQATIGCTDNGCTFCPAYKEKTFRARDIGEIEHDLASLSMLYPGARKLFLADGDAIVLEHERLKSVLVLAAKYFPRLSRISVYGSVKTLEQKTVRELEELKKLRLGIVYLGFETGDEEVYASINKYGNPQGNIDACRKVRDAGIKTNVTVVLGLGGKKRSRQHAVNTARILNAAEPDQIAALTLMIAQNTPLHEMSKTGEFEPLDAFETVLELKTIIENLSDFRCQFFSNHASNYLPVAARFPVQKSVVLAQLDAVVNKRDVKLLRPEFLRGL
ncbi:MAG: radical SAM protein [Endomicrobiales bacterium]|nr:radical SAM protein [Endomicrobiales bacterium]